MADDPKPTTTTTTTTEGTPLARLSDGRWADLSQPDSRQAWRDDVIQDVLARLHAKMTARGLKLPERAPGPRRKPLEGRFDQLEAEMRAKAAEAQAGAQPTPDATGSKP